MIKIALKHWIYEKCIDVLFKAISKNFLISREKNEFRAGDRFEYIVIKDSPPGYSFKLYDCTIVENMGGGRLLIKFIECRSISPSGIYATMAWRIPSMPPIMRFHMRFHDIDEIIDYRRK